MKVYLVLLLSLFSAPSFGHFGTNLMEHCRRILPELLHRIEKPERPMTARMAFDHERAKKILHDLSLSRSTQSLLADLFDLHTQNLFLLKLQNAIDQFNSLETLAQNVPSEGIFLYVDEAQKKVHAILTEIHSTYPDFFQRGPGFMRKLTQNPFLIVEDSETIIESLVSDLKKKKILFLGEITPLAEVLGVENPSTPWAWIHVAEIVHELSKSNTPLVLPGLPQNLFDEQLRELKILMEFLRIKRHLALSRAILDSDRLNISASFDAILNDLTLRAEFLRQKKSKLQKP
jgi:hypothetical protein